MNFTAIIKNKKIMLLSLATLIVAVSCFAIFMNKPQQIGNTPPVVVSPGNGTGNQNTIIDKIVDSISPKPSKGSQQNTISSGDKKIMAWIYPGEPACTALTELKDGRRIDVVKVEYFRVDNQGNLAFLDEEKHGCNAYSASSLETIKTYSKEQYVTVASIDSNSMALFMQKDSETNVHTDALVKFVVDKGMTGVEIDFEDFGGWDASLYSGYKAFIQRLGTGLHENGKKLIIDGPAVSNAIEEKWYQWRYEHFVNLPVDYVTVMAYDYQFDHGVGEPVSPLEWLEDVIDWTTSKFPNKNKLVIGIPSYGYYGTIGQNKQTIATYLQISRYPGFATAQRDQKSGEMMWTNGDNFYLYQDSESINLKLKSITSKGINNVSVWHLGGNKWLSN